MCHLCLYSYSVFLTNCHTTNFSWVPLIYDIATLNCTSVVFLPFRRLGGFSHRLSRQRQSLLRGLAFHSPRVSILHLPSFFLAYHHALHVPLAVLAVLKAGLFAHPFIRRYPRVSHLDARAAVVAELSHVPSSVCGPGRAQGGSFYLVFLTVPSCFNDRAVIATVVTLEVNHTPSFCLSTSLTQSPDALFSIF